ncbi:MAG: hypothetical protein ABR907_06595 [Terracidiphilus sp.]|jgi:uncharacterized membrane protein
MSEPYATPLSENAAGAIAYIMVLPAIVFLFLEPYCKSASVRFHAWQSIFLAIGFVVVSFILTVGLGLSRALGAVLFVSVTQLLWILWILLCILGALQAMNGKRLKLPLLGGWAEKMAG